MSRKISFFIVFILTSLALSGCETELLPAMQEIDQFQIVQVVGIDKNTESSDLVEVTFISQLKKVSTGKGQEGNQLVTVLSSTGPTVFDAERKLKAHSDKIIFLGHVNYFIIGEEAAKEDFSKYFDFINRDHEIRLSPKVFISKGCSAKELINETSSGDRFITDRLKNINSDISLLSNTDQVRIIDVSAMLDNLNAATIIPTLKCEPIRDEKMTGDMPEKDIKMCGYAVIKDFKLTGFIDEDRSRGYNFLVNKVKSCPISVPDLSGKYVGLEVINAKTKVEAHFKGDQLEGVTYNTHITSNIQELQSRKNIFTENAIQDLCSKQSEIMKAELEQVIGITKELKIDCLNLGQIIEMQHPLKWEHIKDKWKEIYPNLKIEIVVKSDIQRTYDIREPNGYQMGS